ncbi:MAG TPA: SseB family protein [Homoserinimonas sp.]|nr:SseB family protein [Homoserinimonas sp.]
MHDHHGVAADSAGQPWAGRSFGKTAFAGDDGTAPPELLSAIQRFRERSADEAAVVDALREARLLIPLVANLGETGVNDHGVTVDKSAELSIVTVAGPDGRNVLPVFSSVDAMRRWNPDARPVPADGIRVALAAADEGTDLVVLDPTSPTEFVIRRPALWSIAQSLPWSPSHLDAEVAAEFQESAADEPAVAAVTLTAGDPDAALRGPELVVQLALQPGLDQSALTQLLERLQTRWAASELIASRVDSLAVKLVPASP